MASLNIKPHEFHGEWRPNGTHPVCQRRDEAAEVLLHGRYTTQSWRVRKDGTRFWADFVIQALRGNKHSLLGFANISHAQLQKHEALAGSGALAQSQKVEAAGQLAGGVAHDFTMLLTVILGTLE